MLLTSVGSPDPPAHPSDSIGAEDDHAAARRVVEAALDTRSSARPCHVPTVDRDRIWQARLKVVTSWSVRRLQLRFCRACNGGSVGVPGSRERSNSGQRFTPGLLQPSGSVQCGPVAARRVSSIDCQAKTGEDRAVRTAKAATRGASGLAARARGAVRPPSEPIPPSSAPVSGVPDRGGACIFPLTSPR